jgi:hypothetical protein
MKKVVKFNTRFLDGSCGWSKNLPSAAVTSKLGQLKIAIPGSGSPLEKYVFPRLLSALCPGNR